MDACDMSQCNELLDGAEAMVGERSEFPGVVARVWSSELATMAGMGTSSLRSEWPKPWVATDVESGMRRCGFCHDWKPFEAFYPNINDPIAQRTSRCKACEPAYQRQYRERAA